MTVTPVLAKDDGPAAPAQSKPIDLVLEGGGVKGIGLVGAILELDAAGYQVRRVAGTSAGAIVASIVAALNAKKQPVSQLHDVLNTISYPDFMRNTGFRGKLGPVGNASGLLFHMGLYDGDYLIEWLGKVLADIGVVHFSDLAWDDPGADSQSDCRAEIYPRRPYLRHNPREVCPLALGLPGVRFRTRKSAGSGRRAGLDGHTVLLRASAVPRPRRHHRRSGFSR